MKNLLTSILLSLVLLSTLSCSEKESVEPVYVGRTDLKQGVDITVKDHEGKLLNIKSFLWVIDSKHSYNMDKSGLNDEPQYNSLTNGLAFNDKSGSFTSSSYGSVGMRFSEPTKPGQYLYYGSTIDINSKVKTFSTIITVTKDSISTLEIKLSKSSPYHTPIGFGRRPM